MSGELDAWWSEQASRTPRRFQLWRAPRRRPTVMVHASNDERTIAAMARRRGGPCVVVDTVSGTWPLVLLADGREQGAWGSDGPTTVQRLVASAEAMRGLQDGEPVRRRLGISAAAAARAAEALQLGFLQFRGVEHPLPGGPAPDLEVEVRGGLVVIVRRAS